MVGNLKPGQRLIEERLARSLQISRTPLREAIQMLEKDGLVNRLPRGGVGVREASSEEIRELNSVRVALECMAVEAVCERVRHHRLDEDEQHILMDVDVLFLRAERAHDRGDVVELLRLGYEFHHTIHVLSRNAYALELLKQTIGLMERYRAMVPPNRNRDAVEEHRAIASAISEGDTGTAVSLMRRHLESAGAHYQDSIRQLELQADASTEESLGR